jgi:capsular exopolysaccharide synthesis family protein
MKEHPGWNDRTAPAEIPGDRRLDLGGMFLRHKWLALFVVGVAFGLGYLFYVRQPAVYQSTARVMVTKEKSSDLPIQGINSSGGSEDSLATQIILLRSPLIVKKAVERQKLAALSSFGGQDPAGQIIAGLNVVRAEEKANILDLAYRSTNPQDCATVLEAVLESYREFLGDTQRSVSTEAVELISEAKDKLLAQLSQKEAEYRGFRQKAPLLWKGNEGTNIHHSRLTQIEDSRSALLISRSQTKAQLQAIESALKRGANREALLLMADKAAGAHTPQASERQSLASQLFPLLLEEELLLESHGPDHPKVKTLQKKISLTKGYLQKEPPAEEAQPAAARPVDFVSIYLESLRQELHSSAEVENELNALFVEEQEAAKAIAVFEVQDETYRNEIARTQQLFDSVVKRLEEINLVKDYGGYKTQLISPPGYGWQVEPSFSRIMTMAGLLGAFAGLALAYALELADKSFRTPDEIRRELGMPVVGHIPLIVPDKQAGTEDAAGLDESLCVIHQPRMRTAEAYRSIRTALFFSTRGDGHKVIQVTSPEPGDGKSTLTSNLAVVIAQSGKNVLLIDADFRRPRIHKIFGLEGSAGMSSVISGEVDLADAVQTTAIQHLSILPCGPRPDNPSELLSLPRFKELLDLFRQQYDFVLIDTPPLMAVTDPCAVAARVDGVLLTLRIKKKGRPNALRATEILESLGVNVLGVVVNGVGERIGYGYGSGTDRYHYERIHYGYASGYEYEYSYGYGYEDDDDADSFSAPAARAKT